VAATAAIGAVVLAVTVAAVGIASEGRSLDAVPGRAWFTLVFLGPFAALGLVVAGSLAAAVASAVTVAPIEPRSVRSRRIVWALAYTAVTTGCVTAVFAVTLASAPLFLVGIAVAAVLTYVTAWGVFARADRGQSV